MKPAIFVTFISLSLIACTLKNNFYKENESGHSLPDIKLESKHPLCTYKEQKGMSELLNYNNNTQNYTFVFYPGDERVEINKSKLENLLSIDKVTNLKINDEIRATKKTKIHGHNGCPVFEIFLTPQ